MNSRGFIITFLVIFFGLMLVALNYSLQENTLLTSDSYKYALSLQKAASKFDNMEELVLAAKQNVGGIDFNVSGDTVSFAQRLPDSTRIQRLDSRLNRLNQFFALFNDDLDVNIDTANFDSTLFNARPFDLNYSQAVSVLRDLNAVYIIPKTIDVITYTVNIILLGDQNFDSLDSSVSDCDGCDYPLSFSLYVWDVNGDLMASAMESVDAQDHSSFLIQTNALGSGDLNIAVVPEDRLYVKNNSPYAVDFNVSLVFGLGNIFSPEIHAPRRFITSLDSKFLTEKK